MSRHTRNRISLTRRFLGWLTPVKAFFILALLLVSAWGAYNLGIKWYLQFRESNLVQISEKNIEEGNYSEAALSAKRALQLNSRSVPATQSMAYLAETLSTPDAILWRSRALELDPENPVNSQALAAAALRFGELQRAKTALEALPDSERNSINFHELSAMIAFSEGRINDTISHFESALKLDPEDAIKEFNLAKAMLFSPSTALRKEAVQRLEKLSKIQELESETLRLLIDNAIQYGFTAQGRDYAINLENSTDPSMADLLVAAQVRIINFNSLVLPIDIQQRLNASSSRYPAYIQRIKKLALQSPESMVQTIQWMYRNGMAKLAILWTRGELLLYQISDPRVQAAIGECYLRVEDWRGLLDWTQIKGADWEYFEYYRYAYQAKALVELGSTLTDSEEFTRIWLQAVEATEMEAGPLELLANRANEWGWESISVNTYWTMANNTKDPMRPLQVLFRYYTLNKNTYGIWRVTDLLVRRTPDDLILKNNLAQLSLLLKTQTRRASEIANSIYDQMSERADYSSTFAFSLLVEKRYKSALRVIRNFPESSLTEPSVALYAGLVYYANDLPEEATRYLSYARADTSNFLPEELVLLNDPSKILNWIETPSLVDIERAVNE